MKKWFSTQQTKEGVSHFLCLPNNVVHFVDIDFFLLSRNIDPTSLTTQVTAVDDGDIEEWREKISSLQSLFMLLNGANTFEASLVGQIP